MKICQRNHDPIVFRAIECPLCRALSEIKRLKPNTEDRMNKFLKNRFADAMTVYPGEKGELDTEFKNFVDLHREHWRFIVKRLDSDISEQRRGGKKEWPPLSEYLLIKGWLSDDN